MRATLCILVALAMFATGVHAAPTPDPLKPPRDRPPTRFEKMNALKHYKKAIKAFTDGTYDVALKEARRAYELDPRPDTLYSIAQVYVKLEQCPEAIQYFERYVEKAKPSETPKRLAIESIAACKAKLAASTEPAKPEPPKPDEPKPDEGLTPPVEPAKPEPPKPEPPKPEPLKPGPPPKAEKIIVTYKPWYKDKLGDILVFSGMLAGGGGYYLYRRALNDLDSADGAATLNKHVLLRDNATKQRQLAVIAGSVGGALFLGGLVRYVFHDNVEQRTIAVVPEAGGATLAIGGAF